MKMKKQIALYGVLLISVLIVMVALRHCGRGSSTGGDAVDSLRDYSDIHREGVLRIIARYNDRDYYVGQDSTAGFVYDVARRLSEISGIRIEISLEKNWKESLERLHRGACDIIAQDIPLTAVTDTVRYRFLRPMHLGRLYLVQRRSDTALIRRQIDLSGRTVTIPEGSPARLFVKHLSEEIGDSIYIQTDPTYSAEQLAMMVASGDIDLTVCNQHEAKKLAQLLPALDCSIPLSFELRQAWLVRRSATSLQDSLNSWFDRLRLSGELERLYDHYH